MRLTNSETTNNRHFRALLLQLVTQCGESASIIAKKYSINYNRLLMLLHTEYEPTTKTDTYIKYAALLGAKFTFLIEIPGLPNDKTSLEFTGDQDALAVYFQERLRLWRKHRRFSSKEMSKILKMSHQNLLTILGPIERVRRSLSYAKNYIDAGFVIHVDVLDKNGSAVAITNTIGMPQELIDTQEVPVPEPESIRMNIRKKLSSVINELIDNMQVTDPDTVNNMLLTVSRQNELRSPAQATMLTMHKYLTHLRQLNAVITFRTDISDGTGWDYFTYKGDSNAVHQWLMKDTRAYINNAGISVSKAAGLKGIEAGALRITVVPKQHRCIHASTTAETIGKLGVKCELIISSPYLSDDVVIKLNECKGVPLHLLTRDERNKAIQSKQIYTAAPYDLLDPYTSDQIFDMARGRVTTNQGEIVRAFL